jgi:hypothetical protein
VALYRRVHRGLRGARGSPLQPVPLGQGGDVATILTAPSLTRYEYEQSTDAISLTRIVVNNKERTP